MISISCCGGSCLDVGDDKRVDEIGSVACSGDFTASVSIGRMRADIFKRLRSEGSSSSAMTERSLRSTFVCSRASCGDIEDTDTICTADNVSGVFTNGCMAEKGGLVFLSVCVSVRIIRVSFVSFQCSFLVLNNFQRGLKTVPRSLVFIQNIFLGLQSQLSMIIGGPTGLLLPPERCCSPI